jgi:Phosphotransferase enzyme family
VPKTVTLALVDEQGQPLGVLPAFDVDFPYWPSTSHIVAAARERFGIGVTVLRILGVEPDIQFGGAVTYLAEAAGIPPAYAGPIDADLSAQPNRAPYAEPGGPAASLRWADQVLRELGRGPVTAAAQHRTWNLSSIWRLETPGGPVWLKEVPRFFWHEPAVLRWLAGVGGDRVPALLASQDGRMLLEHIPGEDLHEASVEVRARIGADYHRLQVASLGQVAHLIEVGIPDIRAAHLTEVVSRVVARFGDGDARLRVLVDGLAQRMAAVAALGLPDTLVHGDLHPGNVRSDGRQRVIIDWGDSFIGHPAFDIIRLTERLDAAPAQALIDEWADWWRAAIPGCEPHRAVDLIRPVAALRNASVYAAFLDNIEPAEHPYHAADMPAWLARAVEGIAA